MQNNETTPVLSLQLNEKKIITCDKKAITNEIFWFDIIWDFITGAISFMALTSQSIDSLYPLLVFSFPIIIKHFIRRKYLKDLATFKKGALAFINPIIDFLLFLIIFSTGFFLLGLSKQITYLEPLLKNMYLVLGFHFITYILSFYDKISMKVEIDN